MLKRLLILLFSIPLLLIIILAFWMERSDDVLKEALRQRALAGKPLQWAEIAPTPVPEDQNGARHLKAAIEVLERESDGTLSLMERIDEHRIASDDWTSPEYIEGWEVMLKDPKWEFFEQHTEALRNSACLQFSNSDFEEIWTGGHTDQLQFYGVIRELCEQSWHQGSHEAAELWAWRLMDCSLLARQDSPLLIHKLINTAITGMSFQNALFILTRGGFQQPGDLDRLEQWATDSMGRDMGPVLQGESVFFVEQIEKQASATTFASFTDGWGLLGGMDLLPSWLQWLAPFYAMRCMPHYLEALDASGNWMNQPAWKRDGSHPYSAPDWDRLTPELMGGILPAADKFDVMDARLALLIIAIRLERLHRAGEAYPESLDQLSGEPLVDPFSGKPFRYQRTEDGFLLYSIGENRRDDGGEYIYRDDDKDDLCWDGPML